MPAATLAYAAHRCAVAPAHFLAVPPAARTLLLPRCLFAPRAVVHACCTCRGLDAVCFVVTLVPAALLPHVPSCALRITRYAVYATLLLRAVRLLPLLSIKHHGPSHFLSIGIGVGTSDLKRSFFLYSWRLSLIAGCTLPNHLPNPLRHTCLPHLRLFLLRTAQLPSACTCHARLPFYLVSFLAYHIHTASRVVPGLPALHCYRAGTYLPAFLVLAFLLYLLPPPSYAPAMPYLYLSSYTYLFWTVLMPFCCMRLPFCAATQQATTRYYRRLASYCGSRTHQNWKANA